MFVAKVANAAQVCKEFSAGDKFQDEVQVALVLTEALHIDLCQ